MRIQKRPAYSRPTKHFRYGLRMYAGLGTGSMFWARSTSLPVDVLFNALGYNRFSSGTYVIARTQSRVKIYTYTLYTDGTTATNI